MTAVKDVQVEKIVLAEYKVGVEMESEFSANVAAPYVRMDKGWTYHREHCGSEVVSPILYGAKGLKELAAQLESLASIKGHKQVGFDNCGLHVHVDIQDFSLGNVKRLLRIVGQFDDVIYAIMDGCRYDNKYCYHPKFSVGQIENCSTFAEIRALQKRGRYYGTNLFAFPEHGTVEFRYAKGTWNWQTIHALIKMYLHIVHWAKSSIELPDVVKSGVLPGSHKRCLDANRDLFFDTIQVAGPERNVLTSLYNTNWNRVTASVSKTEPLSFRPNLE